MSFSHFDSVKIKAISSCVPKTICNNLDYPHLFSEKEKKRLIKLTGIKQRRIASQDVCASDLGYVAAEKLLTDVDFDRKQIKHLIFLSQTPDYKIPFTSNIIQDKLGVSNDCSCLDINAGCNGFISGMMTAYALQQSLSEGSVLLIVAETMSKILSPKDRATTLLFGDAASAILLEKANSEKSYFSSYSDGSKYEVIAIPEGGSRKPFTASSLNNIIDDEGNEKNGTQLKMDGPAVFDFTMKEVIPSMNEIYSYFGINKDQISYFAFHQSNRFILQQFANSMGIGSDRLLINIDRFGNTSGVSIPLLLTTELCENDKKGLVHCIGYGAGLSWGNCILDLSNTEILPLIELTND